MHEYHSDKVDLATPPVQYVLLPECKHSVDTLDHILALLRLPYFPLSFFSLTEKHRCKEWAVTQRR